MNSPRSFFASLLFALFIFQPSLMAQSGEEDIIPGRLMVRMKKGTSPKTLSRELSSFKGTSTDLQVKRKLSEYLNVWLFSYDPKAVDKHALLEGIERHAGVRTAQFEHRLEQRALPNDPKLTQPDMWHYVNDGSNGGVVDADIDADQAWDITTGGTTVNGDTIVVAVIDGGFDIGHEDLNFFKNPAEVNGTNGVDDDGNGYTDDVNGWDAYDSDGTIPSSSHGTHVAGTVGAKGDNNTGYVGVNWSVEVMPIAGSSTNESTVVAAYDYAVKMRDLYDSTNGSKGAFIVATNSSFGKDGGDPSNYPLWCAMYDTLGAYGITNAVAGPNQDVDIDSYGDVPGTCPSPHTLCLTNTENDDSRATAGYGDTHVDLGAPGTDILSTEPSNSYGKKTGTSMASPHVAGTIGLLHSIDCPQFMNLVQNDPDSASMLVKRAIMEGVDTISSLSGITVSNGRLNMHRALLEMDSLGYCDTNTGCFTPYNLQAQMKTDSSALLTYTAPDTADSVKLQYKELAAATWDSATTTSTDSFMIDSGLSGCTQYEFRIKAYCPNDTTGWAGPSGFKTLGCCKAPAGFHVAAQGDSSLSTEWDSVYGASDYEIQYRSVDSISWKGYVVSGTDTSLSGLKSCHRYELRVRADCDTSYSPYSSVLDTNTLCAPCDSNSYCSSKGQSVTYEWIEAVDIAGLSNTSGENGGYLFKGGPNTTLWQDSAYVITLTPGFSGSSFPEFFRIWVDTDRDGVFDSPGERLFEKSDVSSAVTDTMQLPASISSGGSRMRISMQYDSLPSVCAPVPAGEVEEYCVQLMRPQDTLGSCYVPFNLSSNVKSDSSAMLHYDADAGADSVELHYKPLNSGTWSDIWTSSTNSLLVDGLQSCTGYEFRVRSYCGSDTSSWSSVDSFETYGCCDAPKGLTATASDSSSITLDWSAVYSATDYQLSFRPVGSSSWNDITVGGSDTTVEELQECHKYAFRVRADCDTAYSSFAPIDSFETDCAPCRTNAYCAISGSTSQEWIESLQLEGESIVSGDNGGYLQYGNANVELREDSGYVFTLEPGFSGAGNTQYARIWVDTDRSGTFEDPGERFYESSGFSSSFSDTLFIPSSVSSGGARMRVAMQAGGLPVHCTDPANGEIEDYCVLLRDNDRTAVEEHQRGELEVQVRPNPARDRVKLLLSRDSQEKARFTLRNTLGEKVLDEKVGGTRSGFDLSGISRGVYFYRVLLDGKLASGKLVIEAP